MPKHVSLELTRTLHQVLTRHRVFVHVYGKYREQTIRFIDADVYEPYTGFLAGGSLTTMGAFSTSRSVLPPGMKVGRYCSIGHGLKVMGDIHPYRWLTANRFLYERASAPTLTYAQDNPGSLPEVSISGLQKRQPVVGDDVWIAADVTLAKGITIHTGSVVAAHSVVTKDVPPYVMVGGNPARIIKERFPQHVTERLTQLRWWDHEPKQFMGLDIRDIENFIHEFSHMKPDLPPYRPEPLRARTLLRLAEAS